MFAAAFRFLQHSATGAILAVVLTAVIIYFSGRRSVKGVFALLLTCVMGASGCKTNGDNNGQSLAPAKQVFESNDTSAKIDNAAKLAVADKNNSGDLDDPKVEIGFIPLDTIALNNSAEWIKFKKIWGFAFSKNHPADDLQKELDSLESGLEKLARKKTCIDEAHVAPLIDILRNQINHNDNTCNRLMMSHMIPPPIRIDRCREFSVMSDRVAEVSKLSLKNVIDQNAIEIAMNGIIKKTQILYYLSNFDIGYATGYTTVHSVEEIPAHIKSIRLLCSDSSDTEIPSPSKPADCNSLLHKLALFDKVLPEIELVVKELQK